ncbi:MAG TPA: hypothetical protein VHJ17_26415 [Thermomonospora sp.]|nr:hypothetical protein [Thermomonospora sp.]
MWRSIGVLAGILALVTVPGCAVLEDDGTTPAAERSSAAPQGPRTFTLGQTVAGLPRDPESEGEGRLVVSANRRVFEDLPEYQTNGAAGAIYGPPPPPPRVVGLGDDQVVIAGTNGRFTDPRAAIVKFQESARGSLTDPADAPVTEVPPGPLGGAASCIQLPTLSEDEKFTACYWADATTAGMVGMKAKPPEVVADFMRRARQEVTK